VQVSSTDKPEDRSFFANAEEAGFLGRSQRGLGNFIGKVNPDAVVFEERLVEGFARVKGLLQVRAQANGDMSAFDTERDGVRETHAAKKKNRLARSNVKRFGDLRIRLNATESQDPGSRARAASAHLFAEGKDLPEVFFELEARDESAFAALAISNTETAQRLECLASSHAADAHANRDFLFGGDRLADL
jgi:hypothetical protein